MTRTTSWRRVCEIVLASAKVCLDLTRVDGTCTYSICLEITEKQILDAGDWWLFPSKSKFTHTDNFQTGLPIFGLFCNSNSQKRFKQ